MKKIIFLVLFSTSILFAGQWNTSFDKDVMTGEKSAYATLNSTPPTSGMSFPYSDITAGIGIGCDKTSKWIYIYFNHKPNLVNGEINSGYTSYRYRLKYDKEVIHDHFTQDFGSKFLHFDDDEYNIERVRESNKLLLEVEWYGEGNVYFDFDLKGSKKAINKISNYCKNIK